jgi:hypothetical protein
MKNSKRWLAALVLAAVAGVAGCSMTDEEIIAQYNSEHPEGYPNSDYHRMGDNPYHMEPLHLGVPLRSY